MELHCTDVQFGERDTYLLYISTPQGLATIPSSQDVIGGMDDTADDAIIPGLTVDNFDDAQQAAAGAATVMATSDGFESSLGPSEQYVFVKTEDRIHEQGQDVTERFAVVELLQTTS